MGRSRHGAIRKPEDLPDLTSDVPFAERVLSARVGQMLRLCRQQLSDSLMLSVRCMTLRLQQS